MKKFLAIMAIMVLSLSLLAACGNKDAAQDDNQAGADNSLQAVLDNGTLRVGMCPEYPPFESIDENNNIVGFDPALAAAIGEQMGVKVECMNIPWESLIAGLNSGEFDIVMSAMSPEEATSATEAVELSKNYYALADVIVVKADNTTIKTKEDLAGKNIGYQDASASAESAKLLKSMGIEVAKQNPYVRHADAYADLNKGEIDAIIASSSYAHAQAKANSEFKVIDDPIKEAGICVVAKQGSKALIEAVEKGLDAVKANGDYEKIEFEWLGAE